MRCGAHLHGARTMAEGAQIVGCEPARAALRFRAPLFRRFSAVSDPLRTWRVLSQPFDGGASPRAMATAEPAFARESARVHSLGPSCLPAIGHMEQAENRFFAPERRYAGLETLARPFEFGTSFTDDVDRVGSWERDLTKRLVVDDGPAVQMTISLLLIRAGYSVRVASDGERGVAAFETAGFDRSSTSSCRVWTGSRPCD